ncbi:MAG: autotransporter outer membrane beta-barrel domain-containing protein [Akkermansiaceae bacterium]
MKNSVLLSSSLALIVGASSLHSEIITFSGTTAGASTYNRVFGNPPSLSGSGTAVNYLEIPFRVGVDGLYRIETVAPTAISDTTLTIYVGSFDSNDPLTNFFQYNDDGGSGFLSRIDENLLSSEQYIAVVASFSNGDADEFTLEFEGAEIVLVFANPVDALLASFALPEVALSMARTSLQDLGQHIQELQLRGQKNVESTGTSFSDAEFAVWAQGNFGSFKNSLEGVNFESDVYAGAAGVDYMVGENIVVGFALGHAQSDTDLGGDLGDLESNGEYIALYGNYKFNDFYVSGLYSYGWQSMELDWVSEGQAFRTNDIDAETHSVSLDAGYNLSWNQISYGPVVSVDYHHIQTEGFTEGDSSFVFEDQTLSSLTSEIGMQASYTLNTPYGFIIPHARAVWAHEYQNESEIVGLNDDALLLERTGTGGKDFYSVSLGVHWTPADLPMSVSLNWENRIRSGNDASLVSLSGKFYW